MNFRNIKTIEELLKKANSERTLDDIITDFENNLEIIENEQKSAYFSPEYPQTREYPGDPAEFDLNVEIEFKGNILKSDLVELSILMKNHAYDIYSKMIERGLSGDKLNFKSKEEKASEVLLESDDQLEKDKASLDLFINEVMRGSEMDDLLNNYLRSGWVIKTRHDEYPDYEFFKDGEEDDYSYRDYRGLFLEYINDFKTFLREESIKIKSIDSIDDNTYKIIWEVI